MREEVPGYTAAENTARGYDGLMPEAPAGPARYGSSLTYDPLIC